MTGVNISSTPSFPMSEEEYRKRREHMVWTKPAEKANPVSWEEVLANKRRGRFSFWSMELMSRMTWDQWLTACCPMGARDCPAVIDEDDELVCPRCRGTR
jgi:hypothetical protein